MASSGRSLRRTVKAMRPAGADANGRAYENSVATCFGSVGFGSLAGFVLPGRSLNRAEALSPAKVSRNAPRVGAFSALTCSYSGRSSAAAT